MNSEWRKHLNELAEFFHAELLFLSGGHVAFRLPGGEMVTTSATPSDRRALPNVRAELERRTGRKMPRQSAGKYRHRKQSGWVQEPASKKSPSTAGLEMMRAKLNSMDNRIKSWIETPPRNISQEAVGDYIARRNWLANKLRKAGYDVPAQFMEKV